MLYEALAGPGVNAAMGHLMENGNLGVLMPATFYAVKAVTADWLARCLEDSCGEEAYRPLASHWLPPGTQWKAGLGLFRYSLSTSAEGRTTPSGPVFRSSCFSQAPNAYQQMRKLLPGGVRNLVTALRMIRNYSRKQSARAKPRN